MRTEPGYQRVLVSNHFFQPSIFQQSGCTLCSLHYLLTQFICCPSLCQLNTIIPGVCCCGPHSLEQHFLPRRDKHGSLSPKVLENFENLAWVPGRRFMFFICFMACFCEFCEFIEVFWSKLPVLIYMIYIYMIFRGRLTEINQRRCHTNMRSCRWHQTLQCVERTVCISQMGLYTVEALLCAGQY